MPRDLVTAEAIQQAIISRIMSRHYVSGDRLPSVRDLADELGSNRNTVNKAYQMMAELGVIESLPGGRKGFQVNDISRVSEKSLTNLTDYFYQQALNLAWQGLAAGIPVGDALQQMTHAIHEVYEIGNVRAIFYECNMHDSTDMGQYLSRKLDMKIDYGLLDDLYKDVAAAIQRYDLIITTFHHLSEVTAELGDAVSKVVGIDTRLTPDTLLRIARLPGLQIGVVSTLKNTTHMLKHILHSYYPSREIQAAAVYETEAVKKIGRTCDHILVTHTCAEAVEQLIGRSPNVIINFQVDEQSIQFLSGRIHEIQTHKTGDLHTLT